MVLLEERYQKECVSELMEHFGYKNPHQVPKIEKVILNMGLGEAIENPKILDSAVKELTLISGQKPVVTKAKRSIAAFKVREGMPIGCRVTLRRQRMYDFLTKFINIAIPRIRDFRGVSPKAFDGKGNYTLGVKEQIIFPEIDYDKIDKIKGMNVTIVTSAKTDDESRYLLDVLGMPFRK
ncbi:MAG: 50S ribosomal protein L5 [Thermodesulfobacteriota bacterium]|nr:MAG: 50S ribosomal protein L5 [Thermodesulfobacteriota bacterium]